MTTEETITVIVPSSPADRIKVRTQLQQMVDCLVRMDAERAAKKDISDKIHADFGIPKKLIGKMARTMHKRNYSEVRVEQQDFETLYEKITNATSTTPVK